MAQIIRKRLTPLLIPIGLIGGMMLSAEAMSMQHMEGYAVDASRDVVKNGAGGCWHTVGGVKEKIPECGDVVMAADSDGDGVPDDRDDCPNTPRGAPVDARGCPLDSDGDGVPDYRDLCPGTPPGVKVDSDGCEVVKPMPAAVPQKVVVENILLFEFDSAQLKGGAANILDSTFDKFKGNDAVGSVMITGHTDSIGSDAYNQGLSERRANTVRDYLISQGADPQKLQVQGLGESQPAYTNDTKAGRQMNRRVEFDVIMK